MNLSNSVRILDAVRKDSPSRKELAEATGIPWGSMCNAVNALLERGLLVEIRRKASSPGRPSVPLSINADAGFLAGVDIGASKTRILFTDLNFRILFQRSVETERYSTEERFFAWCGGLFEAALTDAGIPRERIIGTGLSVSGNVDPEAGIIASGGNWGLKQGAALPVAELAHRFGTPVYAITTLAAMVYGEYRFGRRAGCADLVGIGLGVGVGSGVISQHQLLVSLPGRTVGYIGHLLIPGNLYPCNCGFTGCLEAYSGGEALGRVARRELPGRPELHTAAALDRAAAAGDAEAERLLRVAARNNAAGIASMIQLYSPEALIFSGRQSRPEGFLYNATLEELNRYLPAERRNCFIDISILGDWLSARGAARLAFERFI